MIGIDISINTEFLSSGGDLPLDEVENAQSAFSMARKLRTDYSGDAFRIRRSSDDAETDIGFSGNDVDESAITSFVGANSAYIVTMYDQSGNSNDWAQATTANQPRIVNAGTLDKENGKLCMVSDSTDDIGLTMTGGASSTAFAVVAGNTNSRILLKGQTGSYFFGCSASGSGSNSYSTSGTPSIYVNSSSIGGTRDNLYDATNGIQSIISHTGLDLSGYTSFNTYYGSGFVTYEKIQELIIYNSDVSASRTTLETNINDYYSIY